MTTTESPVPRIDDYIKRHFAEASSDAAVALKETARAAARHGFTGSANARYAAFLEAFTSSPALSAKYKEAYPSCMFLPWAAFHQVRKSLKLWCDLPENYAGAVPPEQLPWLDMFELADKDGAQFEDTCGLLEITEPTRRTQLMMFLDPGFSPGFGEGEWADLEFRRMAILRNRELRTQMPVIREAVAKFTRSFFVLAPPEAFSSTEDFIERFKNAAQAVSRLTTAPDDPLVIRFCRGGCLVVAAWGDEAAEMNKLTRELGI